MKKALECKVTCDLYKTCKSPFMKMTGDPMSQILLIGEGPGAEEDDQNIQFVGDSGKLLRHVLKLHNITDFVLNNVVRCRPPKNRDPKTVELKTCKTFLDADIAAMPNLKLIVLLGNCAMQSILGHKGILEHSGTLIKDNGYNILPIMHPSYVLQNQNELNNFINHVGRIPNALSGTLIDLTDEGTYIVIDNLEKWKELVNKIWTKKEFVYDLETNSLDPYLDDTTITCISFSTEPREAYVLPLEASWAGPNEWVVIYTDLKNMMETSSIGKIGQNIKFDNLWMRIKLKIDVRGTRWDTSFSQYLLDENESHGLKSMAWKYSKLGGYERRLVQGEPHMALGPNLWRYSAIDADLTNRIYHIHQPLLYKDSGLSSLQQTLLIPVNNVLLDMEHKGIKIDIDKLQECEKAVDAYLDQLQHKLLRLKSIKQFETDSGLVFNARSTKHLQEILFKYEGLRPIKFTEKTRAPSTDREVLAFYENQSKVCEYLGEYSSYGTMKSKMIKELYQYNRGGRIHTHYWITETATGRSSSDDPNLQNVTKGKKDVVGIRQVFVADEGFKLVEMDYNQHELRCMAELAQDNNLYKSVTTGDAHTATAAVVLQKNPLLVTDDERRDVGKTFNFGFIYGLTKWGIMKRLNCSEHVAQQYLDKFFGLYSKTKLLMDATALFVKENGYVKSRTGRYRRFPIWNELDEKSIREAINMPVQSLAGDILLYSLIGIHNFLKKENAKSYLCLEVHDSLLLNIHEDEIHLISEIKRIMLTYFRNYIPFDYQLGVDVKIGNNWGMMEKLNV